MPFIPAEPRLRHCSLRRSTGSLACLELSIFLHFCLISVSDLDVAAMLLSIVCNKYGALRESRRFLFFCYPDNDRVVPSLLTELEPWAQIVESLFFRKIFKNNNYFRISIVTEVEIFHLYLLVLR